MIYYMHLIFGVLAVFGGWLNAKTLHVPVCVWENGKLQWRQSATISGENSGSPTPALRPNSASSRQWRKMPDD
jgi:hypothetical protein